MFLQENIEGMGKALRMQLQQMETEFSVLQVVFSVYVEVCRNILRYSARKCMGSLEIRQEGGDIVIEGKNYITVEQKEALRERLECLSKMNKQQIHQVYIEQRRKEES